MMCESGGILLSNMEISSVLMKTAVYIPSVVTLIRTHLTGLKKTYHTYLPAERVE